jgi:hypothetical protein
MKKIIERYLYNKYGRLIIWNLIPYKFKFYYYDFIRPIFKPEHRKLRESIPRTWADTVSLIVKVNFAMITEFYEDEYLLGFVDWKGSSKEHGLFEKWLQKTYKYIKEERVVLMAKLDSAYPPVKSLNDMFEETIDNNGKKSYLLKDDGIPYKTKYKEVLRLEKLIHKKDTDILKNMIDNRDYFWT